MPNMANITVKNKADVNVTYVAATPSSGDRVPAVWTRNDASGRLDSRPRLSLVTRNSGGQLPGRIAKLDFNYPVLVTNPDTSVSVGARMVGTIQVTLPTNVDATAVSDACVQMANLFASALIQSVMEQGYAPT